MKYIQIVFGFVWVLASIFAYEILSNMRGGIEASVATQQVEDSVVVYGLVNKFIMTDWLLFVFFISVMIGTFIIVMPIITVLAKMLNEKE